MLTASDASPGKLTPGAFFSSANGGLPKLAESDAVIIVYGFMVPGSGQSRANLAEAKFTGASLNLTTEIQDSHVHEVQFSPDRAR